MQDYNKPNLFLLTTKPFAAQGNKVVSKISVPEEVKTKRPGLSLAASLPEGILELSPTRLPVPLGKDRTSQLKVNITLWNAVTSFI